MAARPGILGWPGPRHLAGLRQQENRGFGQPPQEYYQCEDCNGCPHREKCHRSQSNRIVRINEERTQFHNEVLNNLNSIHGALLRMNRSIQAEGAFW
ncbi:MAG: transposase [Oscillospiraceae bacterium]|nr:transposase [Oscillospiraceae bacterium]